MSRPLSATRVNVICPICGVEFTVRQSRKRKYCSKKCTGIANAQTYAANRKKSKCLLCGKIFSHRPGAKPKYCGIICSNTAKARANAKKHGDMLRGKPTGRGNSYVKEGGKHQHRRVMEKHLDRKLKPNEIVHHKNKNIKDNQLENLELTTQSKHINLHREDLQNGKLQQIEAGSMLE